MNFESDFFSKKNFNSWHTAKNHVSSRSNKRREREKTNQTNEVGDGTHNTRQGLLLKQQRWMTHQRIEKKNHELRERGTPQTQMRGLGTQVGTKGWQDPPNPSTVALSKKFFWFWLSISILFDFLLLFLCVFSFFLFYFEIFFFSVLFCFVWFNFNSFFDFIFEIFKIFKFYYRFFI